MLIVQAHLPSSIVIPLISDLEKIDQVTCGEIIKLAAEIMDLTKCSLCVVGDKKNADFIGKSVLNKFPNHPFHFMKYRDSKLRLNSNINMKQPCTFIRTAVRIHGICHSALLSDFLEQSGEELIDWLWQAFSEVKGCAADRAQKTANRIKKERGKELALDPYYKQYMKKNIPNIKSVAKRIFFPYSFMYHLMDKIFRRIRI